MFVTMLASPGANVRIDAPTTVAERQMLASKASKFLRKFYKSILDYFGVARATLLNRTLFPSASRVAM
jgi:hypothetical protein